MFSPSLSFFSFWLLLFFFEQVCADRNITVDDNDASIQYSPGWSVSSGVNPLDYGGQHHLSDSSSANATFQFSGTAVYIMAPLWPYKVGAAASVDGSSPVMIAMQDLSHTTDGGGETVSTAALWGMTGLNYSSHTLEVSFFPGMEFMGLDAILYTVEDAPGASQSATTTSVSATTSAGASSSSASHRSTIPIILGAVLGAALLGIVVVGTVLLRLRKAKKARNYGGTAGSDFRIDSESAGTTTRELSSSIPSTYNFEAPIASEYNSVRTLGTYSDSRGGLGYSLAARYDKDSTTSTYDLTGTSHMSNGGPPAKVTLTYGVQNPDESGPSAKNVYSTLSPEEEKQNLTHHYDAPPSYS